MADGTERTRQEVAHAATASDVVRNSSAAQRFRQRPEHGATLLRAAGALSSLTEAFGVAASTRTEADRGGTARPTTH